jgi:nickel transport protein
MKSLVRWGATLGLVGSTLLGSFFTANLRALALPDKEVANALRPIPVFTVTDAQGAPLVATVPLRQGDSQTANVAGVFMSQQDANAFLARLKTDNPDLGNSVQIVPVSLAEVYELEKKNQNQTENLDFAFIPKQDQVQLAQPLWEAQIRSNPNAQQNQQFQGVPLFVAKAGPDQGYLTIQPRDGVQLIPFFFEKNQLQNMVDRYKQQQPNQSGNITIEVVSLEGLISTLQSSNNEDLTKIMLVPSQESQQFLQNLQNNSSQ